MNIEIDMKQFDGTDVPDRLQDALQQAWDAFNERIEQAAIGLIQQGYSSDELQVLVTPLWHDPDEGGATYLKLRGRIMHRETGEQLYPHPEDAED